VSFISKKALVVFSSLVVLLAPPCLALAQEKHGDSCATATYLNLNTSVAAAISPAGNNDYFRVYAPGSGTLTAYTTGATNTYGYLLNSACAALAYNDDGGTDANFRIARSVLAGHYFVRVRHSRSTSGTGSYRLQVAYSGPSGSGGSSGGEAGSSCSSYMEVSYYSRINGTISFIGDNDYYHFWHSGGYLLAYTTGGTDTHGYLYTPSCALVTHNDGGGSGANFRIYTNRAAGCYYVRVHEHGNNATGPYTLYLGNGSTSYPESGAWGGGASGTSCARATYISLGQSYTGRIDSSGDNDYYRVSVPRSGNLIIQTSGSNDTYGYLLNSNCVAVTSSDGGGSGLNFRIQRYVSPGIHYIRVRCPGSRTGSYLLYTWLL